MRQREEKERGRKTEKKKKEKERGQSERKKEGGQNKGSGKTRSLQSFFFTNGASYCPAFGLKESSG